jgi:hypothetical protein
MYKILPWPRGVLAASQGFGDCAGKFGIDLVCCGLVVLGGVNSIARQVERDRGAQTADSAPQIGLGANGADFRALVTELASHPAADESGGAQNDYRDPFVGY